ncbi:hypothetical protein Pth03_01900 [Planotetraspora thailandica]|uniref:non-specific serine/threonine protein kinase n=2 Tax=Planotetraspora thailandica TaxID=487172 RepID=A0A8J3XTP1_9ACTN|nr:hypothetical protein Pth03_01900 [Planotetraspora thailandica]
MWQAHDLRLKRDVVVKEVRPPAGTGADDLAAARQQALREARSAARLTHPSVVTVHDLLEDQGRLWMVTELLRGLTLDETVRHLGRLPVHWAAWVGFQLLAGVQHAHVESIVHGDVNPSNVLLTEDRVVLTEFVFAGSAGTPRRPGSRLSYTAPERLLGEAATAASDLWSFGATLHFAVAGRAPGEPADAAGDDDSSDAAGPLRPVLDGLLRADPAERLSADAASALLVDLLRRQGIAAALPGRRAEALQPGAFTM